MSKDSYIEFERRCIPRLRVNNVMSGPQFPADKNPWISPR